eukprot:PITA_21139
MHIVSWNCRGLGNPMKAEAVKDLLRMEPSYILLLQETNIEEYVLLSLSQTKWKRNSGKAVSARGKEGLLAYSLRFSRNLLPQNIILAGDLNITLDPNEKKGGVWGKDPFLVLLESLILAWDLLDLKPKKGRYTWTNNRVGNANIVARLDQFLVQSTLMEGKHLISSKILPKITSDPQSHLTANRKRKGHGTYSL